MRVGGGQWDPTVHACSTSFCQTQVLLLLLVLQIINTQLRISSSMQGSMPDCTWLQDSSSHTPVLSTQMQLHGVPHDASL
jgi:hypothetical protein